MTRTLTCPHCHKSFRDEQFDQWKKDVLRDLDEITAVLEEAVKK